MLSLDFLFAPALPQPILQNLDFLDKLSHGTCGGCRHCFQNTEGYRTSGLAAGWRRTRLQRLRQERPIV
jgi:hypothetical protein